MPTENASSPPASPDHDVIIVGGGPAGLSAALILARCCRHVLVVDAGEPRNAQSHAIHGYLGRDGVTPADFQALAHAEITRYASVTFWSGEVADIGPGDGTFRATLVDGRSATGRKILLATGVVDEWPPIPGSEAFRGVSVFMCPYCDGWELRDRPIALYATGEKAFRSARTLAAWTRAITICGDGPVRLSRAHADALRRHGITWVDTPIRGLEGNEGRLSHVVFADGLRLACEALFFNTPSHRRERLLAKLGCQATPEGGIRHGKYQAAGVPGVYVAGNALRDVQLAIVASAEGARAAFGINKDLSEEDFARS